VVNTQRIKARIVEFGLTQKQVSELLGIGLSSFNLKLNNTGKRRFTLTEVQELMTILKIEDPKDYFFVR